jgi:hypothetical protein
MFPSVGNWTLPCQSHYWIRNGKILWARRWTEEEIAIGKARDEALLERSLSEPLSWWRRIKMLLASLIRW